MKGRCCKVSGLNHGCDNSKITSGGVLKKKVRSSAHKLRPFGGLAWAVQSQLLDHHPEIRREEITDTDGGDIYAADCVEWEIH